MLFSRPFDKINMTWGQGQLPRRTGSTGRNQHVILLQKSVCGNSYYLFWTLGMSSMHLLLLFLLHLVLPAIILISYSMLLSLL